MLSSYTLAFGIITILLGAVGYLKAKSKASLISGGISGLLILLGWWFMQQGKPWGLYIALGVSVLLLGRFLPNFLKTKKVMPAGVLSILAIIELALGVSSLM
jgi:uncharacterized membrane protein (UPF0136 family)